MKRQITRVAVAVGLAGLCGLADAGRPTPRKAALERLEAGVDIIGIVHWGPNTYTDREWGFGNEDPSNLNPTAFDADQIVSACKAGGIKGLVVVAKHHDGFCLWPTKTTAHNISKSPFRGGKGDYVKEMADACRRAGLRFGVYVSPWDRNNAAYATPAYVDTYHAQIKELLSGTYGDVFEMWFDGANGGTGWYGGSAGVKGERRTIKPGYYRFPEVFRFVRDLQPKVCIFGGEGSGADFRWPGNEQGLLDPDSRATVDGSAFLMCEADFPLRPGWFYHASQRGKTKCAAYLVKLYLSSVGNGGIMNIGIAPDRAGRLNAEDVRALAGFGVLRKAFFAHPVTKPGAPFNVVDLGEDLTHGEQVDGWALQADGRTLLTGTTIGHRRIRVLGTPSCARDVKLVVTQSGNDLQPVVLRRYLAEPELVKTVLTATTESGETDTARWMRASDAFKEKTK